MSRLDGVRVEIEPDVVHALEWIRNGGPSGYDLREALRYLEWSATQIRRAIEEDAG